MDSLFYGFVLFFLNFEINGIDVLPDCIGYYLMYRGLKELSPESRHFAEMKPWAAAMAAVSGVLFVTGLMGLPLGSLPVRSATTIAALFITYRLIQGIQELEGKLGAAMESELLMRRWKNICIVSAANLFLVSVQSFRPIRLGIVAAVLAITSFVLYILFLMTLHRSRQAYYAAAREPHAEYAAEAEHIPFEEPEQPSEPSE